MSYQFTTPEEAYKEAQSRIQKAKATSARSLFLANLGLITVPPELAQLSNLDFLRLDNNRLDAIPIEIFQLENLEKLHLDNNNLINIPSEISQLRKLQELVISRNQLTIIPQEFAQLKNLRTLYFDRNKLTVFPIEFTQLVKLIYLDLSNNQLTGFPQEIVQLINLQELYLSRNHLTDFHPGIAELLNLEKLWLDNNQLTGLPSKIVRLDKLKYLNISNNRFSIFPNEVIQLINLQELYLNNNKISILPSQINKLKNLIELHLNNNQIAVIPVETASLIKLKELYLHDNYLTTIPSEIANLANLEKFYLYNNNDLSISKEVIDQWDNPKVILEYLQTQQEDFARPLNEAKLIFVGQPEVGKTSLVKRLIGEEYCEQENQTAGISIKPWQLKVNRIAQGDIPISLNIWDFGGQEIMHATHQFFLTKRSLYLLVIDARQDEDEGRLEYWLSLINSFASNAPVLIIINKIDQRALDINRRGLQQKYPSIQGFVTTSARDNIGISRLKTKIATILGEMNHIDTLFPASWWRVKRVLTAMQKKLNFLDYHEYEDVCRRRGVTERGAQKTLVRFMHDLGIMLSFLDDPRIRTTSVLNPHWVTDGVYTILNSSILQKQHGVLRRQQLDEILSAKKYPQNQYHFLLDMMLKFELAFEMDRDTLLIPDLITKEEPEFTWNEKKALHFAYHYHILPRSILHRFMVRQYHLVDSKIRWRTGVMLQHEGLSALVKADIKEATIRIAINGNGDRRKFLYSLRLSFAGIHESITGIQPEEVVPIPGFPKAPPIPYQFLLELEEDGFKEQRFLGVRKTFHVQELLNGITTSAMRKSGIPSRTQIQDILRRYFNKYEFFDLLFKLDVDQNILAGEPVDAQKRELVLYMERNGRLAQLVEAMRKERPNLDFR